MLFLNFKGVAACLLVIILMGVAAANGGGESWSEASWSGGEVEYEGEDSLVFSETSGGDGTQFEYMISLDTGTGADTSQYDAQVSQYTEFYSMGQSAPAETSPVAFDISGQAPSTLSFGGQTVPYAQYQSYAMMYGANALWIRGSSSWTQYAMVPMYSSLQLVAYTTSGGTTNFYEIYPSGTVLQNSYWFSPGYNSINFYADAIGRHILLFVTNYQPSSAVVIDVVGGGGGWPPGPTYGNAKVTIASNWLTGYTVYVDNVYKLTENGDGYCSFTVNGDQYHTIKVTKGGYSYSQYKYFRSGRAYTLTI